MGEQGRLLRWEGRHGGPSWRSGARKALEVLADMMDLADPVTSEHGDDVADLVHGVGRLLGVRGRAMEELHLAARFHDIGKIAVPEPILKKPGPLDELERDVMARHVEWGAELLATLPECGAIARIVRHHHERWDGRGYPDGLAGNEIPLGSRIIGACDAYGAMTSHRPYRRALEQDAVVEEMRAGAGTQFDPDAVAAVIGITHRRRTRRRWSVSRFR